MGLVWGYGKDITMEKLENTEHARGVLDTATSLFKTLLSVDSSMQKGEEVILLTLVEKADEAAKSLLDADSNQVNRVIGIISTVVDTNRSILENDSNTAKQVIQLLGLLNDKMAEAIKELQ